MLRSGFRSVQTPTLPPTPLQHTQFPLSIAIIYPARPQLITQVPTSRTLLSYAFFSTRVEVWVGGWRGGVVWVGVAELRLGV